MRTLIGIVLIRILVYPSRPFSRRVDFVVKEGLKVKQLIQVTYASGKDEIERREIKSLVNYSTLSGEALCFHCG